MFSVYLCFMFFAVLFAVDGATTKETCEGSCILADKCRFFGNLNKDEQSTWLTRFICEEEPAKASGSLFGFSASAKGDIVCCPENVWEIEDPAETTPNNKQNYETENGNGKVDEPVKVEKKSFFYPNNNYQTDNRAGNNYGDRYTQDNRNNNGNQYDQNRNDNRYANNGEETDDEITAFENTRIWQNRHQQRPVNNNQNPYFLPANRNTGNTGNSFNGLNSGGQCPVTSFPPDPNTGCCGREASEDNGNAGYQYPQSNPGYDSQSSWMPQRNRPSASWPSWTQYSDTDRKKRDANNNSVTVDNRIAGGRETELEQFPWTVLLKTTFIYPTKEAAFSCGGSLISSRYVLTAGHCIYDQNGSIKDVEIYLAEYDKRSFPKDCKNVLGKGQQCVENIVMNAESVHLHPQYDDNRLSNDIALIRLRGNAPYTDYIRPICLPPINVDSPQLSNLRLAVAGWGRNGQYKSNIKQSTVVNLVPNTECRESYPGLTTQQVCAAGYTGEDTCKGDSGGPLMMLYGGKYYVSGVVSGKRADAPCGTSVPSLYTNVYQYLQWIRSVIKN